MRQIEFIGDLADDLFQDVLQGDQAAQGTVLIHHQGEMRLAFQKLAHLFIQRGGVGHEIGLHRDLQDIQIGQRLCIALRPAHQPVDLAQQVLGVDHAKDVLIAVPVDGQTGVRRGEDLGQDIVGAAVGIDHFNLAAVTHDLVHCTVVQIKGTQQAVAVFLFHRPPGMAKGDGPDDFLAQGQDMPVRIGAHAKQAQQQAHKCPHHRDDGREHKDHHPDQRGHAGCGHFGIGDGIGLWQHLAEDQYQGRHDKGGQGDAAVAVHAGQQGRSQRGRGDVDDVVAQQQGADHAFVVFGNLQRCRRPG